MVKESGVEIGLGTGWRFIKSLGDRQENREGDADCTEGARETELGRSPRA